MGTGSEREHGIFSEKAPPLGACPPFQRRGGGPAQKMGLTTVANCVFPDFSQEATEPVPFFGLPCLHFEYLMGAKACFQSTTRFGKSHSDRV